MQFHPHYTIWLPAAFFIFQVILELFLPDTIMNHVVSENGPHEFLQCLIAFAGSVLALQCALRAKRQSVFLCAWCVCFAAGCFYIAAEEISWGQWIFKWTTSEYWTSINDQQETNLHNISSWLDQKPKALVLIGILVGGIIFPLLEKYTKTRLPERFLIIYPPITLIFVALCIAAVKLGDVIDDQIEDFYFWARDSEIEEIFVYYYLLLYIVQLRGKIFARI